MCAHAMELGSIIKEVVKSTKSPEDLAATLRSFSGMDKNAALIEQVMELVEKKQDAQALPLILGMSNDFGEKDKLLGFIEARTATGKGDRTRISSQPQEKTVAGLFTDPNDETIAGTLYGVDEDEKTLPGRMAA